MVRTICEHLGWKRGHIDEPSFANPATTIKRERWISPDGIAYRKLPDLTLDWMHSIECAMSDDDYTQYLYELHRVIESTSAWMNSILSLKAMAVRATKEQRAEAFLNHIKWKEAQSD